MTNMNNEVVANATQKAVLPLANTAAQEQTKTTDPKLEATVSDQSQAVVANSQASASPTASGGSGIVVPQYTANSSFYTSYRGDQYFPGKWSQRINWQNKFLHRKTGFAKLDKSAPFLPAVNIICAPPGEGKTTIVQQICENMAEMQVPVIIFSLEMSPFYLFSKSLSRLIFKASRANGGAFYTALDLRCGRGNNTPELLAAIDYYTHYIGPYTTVIDCDTSITISTILNIISLERMNYNTPPVVMIDYLQLIAPPDANTGRDVRMSLDYNIKRIKAYQKNTDTTFFLISSVGKASYSEPLGLESLKESGMCEYTADTVFALQPDIMFDDRFYYCTGSNGRPRQTTPAEKKRLIAEEKTKTPRKVRLSVLKRRDAAVDDHVTFDYYSAYDYFECV